ncbi:cell division protein ZapB [Saccharolobus solfataricus]|uniref:Cell division protein ZapB n=2 Tax=Saccharolobus solfataricus TaxID=2287 RepID=A0A0E3GTI2_SACSO|nr:cell division protein ZapB [Saccharolobus solfataricus]AKA73866.1 cell division protein ZapB [Saccharolobus solfataricus]AKA76564.1 cell division protein ZapB [Saccharolobus solfataricus]AKA79257.1 cell division protein ZapB [Saccharolobus solfataricus]AZF68347.1 cell division protein ZapB [Saccharolobus solfataricus]AZF70967.1 cell division protein ZapB [Saccharolobus solfataricus]
MTVSEIIRRNEELELQYAKAIDTITRLQNRIKKLEKENISLKDENLKLKRMNNILMRAIEIAIQIKDYNAQTRHLQLVLQKLRETGEFKG